MLLSLHKKVDLRWGGESNNQLAHSSYFVVVFCLADDYKVTSLPGVDMASIPFDQYAG